MRGVRPAIPFPPIPGSLEKAHVLAAAGRIGDAFMLLATAPDRDSPASRALEAELRAKLPCHEQVTHLGVCDLK